MDGFTIIDAVVAVVIIVSAILAYSRGFMRETMSIVGWIAAAIIAFMFAHKVEPLIREIPYVGERLAGSCELSIIAAFAAVFAVALVVVSLFTPLFSGMIRRSVLGGLDQGLGFLFGALRGILLVAVVFVVYDRVVTNQTVAMVDDSRSAQIFASMQNEINDQIPNDAPGWILERYEELVGTCGKVTPGGADVGAVEG
ncbi:MAG: CvpA family protein [Paracoccaceae bacterium]|nr:putative Colicin V production protein, dedE [Rhodobacterales bacterium HTCC2150] [Rhodobacteraceae bacterium HTCC2150]MDG1531828.1 CvpA family protein [Paracoccaceae bacterium]